MLPFSDSMRVAVILRTCEKIVVLLAKVGMEVSVSYIIYKTHRTYRKEMLLVWAVHGVRIFLFPNALPKFLITLKFHQNSTTSSRVNGDRITNATEQHTVSNKH